MASVVAALMESTPRTLDDVIDATRSSPPEDSRSSERAALLTRLLDSVKQCQIRFGKRQTLATEGESQVICLLTNLEAALSHGLKPVGPGGGAIASIFATSKAPDNGANSLWTFVKTFLGADEVARFDAELKHVTTDLGRGRAWIRTALNENTLERYLYSLVNDVEKIQSHYEKWSFMRDEEKSSMLPSLAAGLKTILFNISVDAHELNNAPRGAASGSEARNILNAIPLGGMIRDVIAPGSSLPSAASSFVDAQFEENFLEPVIVAPKPSTSEKTVSSKVIGDNKKISRKSGGKKKKKTVAHIVDLDENRTRQPLRHSPTIAPTTNDIREAHVKARHANSFSSVGSLASEPETVVTSSDNVAESPLTRHRRISEPPANLPIRLSKPSEAADASEAPKIIPAKESYGNAATELTFVGVGGVGAVMSPVTPASQSAASWNDNDTSDAQSITSTGQMSQTSVVSSASDVPSSRSYNGNGACATQSFCPPKVVPTLLTLRNERLLSLKDDPNVDAYRDVNDAAAANSPANAPANSGNLEALSIKELKDAIVSIMQRKDEVSATNGELCARVEMFQQENGSLHEEIERLERRLHDADVKFATKSKFLDRENELLKHQLKKYVGAVQVLERQRSGEDALAVDDTAAPPSLEQQLANSAASMRDHAADVDADQIRSSYEQKLVQVSEMHGDLMEFNDQLVLQIKQKDRLIDQLKQELEELRGPLPADFVDNADVASVISDAEIALPASALEIPSSGSSFSFRALVNIWIPSAFLQTTNKDTFHVYQVYLRIRDEEWNVYRRYAQFYDLHKSMKKLFPDSAAFPFPPKKALGNKDEQFVENRRVKLQHYLRQLLNYLTQYTGYELAHAHPITKERLLAALPFFSDRAPASSESVNVGRPSPSSSKSRGRLRTSEEPTTPQYTGL